MILKTYFEKSLVFAIKRVAELVGLLLMLISILLLISLVSYSPDDPNFIFPENAIIHNILGSKGSFIADIFFQSLGLISFLIPFSFFFTGLRILVKKNFLIILENIFFIIFYSILGCLFFTVYHTETFWLYINGNNGFVGDIFKNSFLIDLINVNQKLSYYILLIFIIFIFGLSIIFKIFNLISYLKKIKIFYKKKDKDIKNNYTDNINYTEEKVLKETRVQENFSFDVKSETNKTFLNLNY